MTDWNQLAQTEAGQALLAQPWPELGERPAPPKPDLTLFPPNLRRMMEAVAASTRAPIELAVVCALGVSSACAVGRVGLNISPGWTEPGQLFLLGVAPPTAGKSPVYNAMVSPLTACFDQGERAKAAENTQALHLRETIEAQLAQAKKKGDRARVALLVEELNALPAIDQGRRYTSGDATPEALLSLMGRNRGRMAQLDDEGKSLDMVTERFSNLPDLSPWIDGHTGERTIHVERKNGSFMVENAALSSLVLTQPIVLDRIVSANRLSGKGFLARFLIVRCNALKGWAMSIPIPQQVRADYESDVCRMAGLDRVTLTLTPDAAAVWQEWEKRSTLALQGEWNALAVFGFKLKGLPARLAVNLALWECGVQDVDSALLTRAVRLAEWFILHLLNLFGDEWTLSREADAMLEVIRGMVKRGKPLRERDMKNLSRARDAFKVPRCSEVQNDALDELQERGYIRLSLNQPSGGRWYDVNPTLKEAVQSA